MEMAILVSPNTRDNHLPPITTPETGQKGAEGGREEGPNRPERLVAYLQYLYTAPGRKQRSFPGGLGSSL